MDIIPAIDLADGRCVRLRQGDMQQQTVYSDDPAEMARHWEAEGARLLHVVDLDGAVGGRSANLAAVEAIVEALDIPVEMGGGLRTAEDVDRVLEMGVQWAIMGTSALRNRPEVEAAVERHGERIIVGIDARDGLVAVEGWQEASDMTAVALAQIMQALGVGRLICTDIATDGMMAGPNVASLAEIARAVTTPITASGGVTTVEDIRRLKEIEPLGVTGAIIGKALYEKSITIAEALAAAE